MVQPLLHRSGRGAVRRFEGGPDAALAQAIDQAQYTVEVAAYEFDLWSLRDALIRAHRRGATVRRREGGIPEGWGIRV
ncbi:MAG: hypothetical protein AAB321_00640 [Chloroflexota bacterium]